MQLPKKVYDVIKYVVLIAIPAFCTAYLGIDGAVDLPHENEVIKIAAVLATFLGTLVGLSAVKYNNSDDKYDGTIDPYYANAVTAKNVLDIPAVDGEMFEPVDGQKDLLLKVVPADEK